MGLDRLQLLLRALRYYDLPNDYQRIFTPDGNGGLDSMRPGDAASRDIFAWVQINETDKSFPIKKPYNKDIIVVRNISFDFELPQNPSMAHAVAEQFSEWLSTTFYPAEAQKLKRPIILPIEDTGAGAHVVVPIDPINTRIYGGGDVVNMAVKLAVERNIREHFFKMCEDHGVQMKLGAYDIARLLSAPGTWRPGGTKPDEIGYLLDGYMRRYLPPFDTEEPERIHSSFLHGIIIDLTDEAHKIIQSQKTSGVSNTGGGGSPVNPQHDPEFVKWLNSWVKRNPNSSGNRSDYFHRMVCASYRRMHGVGSVVIDHADLIDDLSGAKFNGRSIQEVQRSLQQAKQMVGSAVKVKGFTTTQDYLDMFDSLGYSFRLNECGMDVELNDGKIDDITYSKIINAMSDAGFISETRIRHVMNEAADLDRYHPIRQYLEKCGAEHDGGDYISKIVDYFSINEEVLDENGQEIAKAWMRKWFIGAVAKALDHEQNVVLVLEGPQDIGKSTLPRWLCKDMPEFHTEEHVNLMWKETDTLLRATNTWIWEVGELGVTTRKQDVEMLKAFLTKMVVTARRPYDRRDVKIPVLASFIGTVNENGGGFLSDPTGNRRYAIIPITKIDFGYEVLSPSKLWGEAYCAYKAGEEWRITGELARIRDEVNMAYFTNDPLPEIIMKFFNVGNNYGIMTAVDISIELKRIGIFKNTTRSETTSVGIALKKISMVKKVKNRKFPQLNCGYYYEGIAPKSLSELSMVSI